MKSKASKQKSNLSIPIISKEMSFCISNGVKVYPVNKNSNWFVEVESNGKLTTFNKPVPTDEIQSAIYKTWMFYYDKLKSLQNGTNKGNNNP